MGAATRAEVCVTACADAWRGDGAIVASPMGTIPTLGARLAKATFEPELLITDGEAYLLAASPALDTDPDDHVVEGYLPFRAVFDVVAAGRRHVMMGASQLARYGDQNIAAIGDPEQPKVQLLGFRGAPGNTVNHTTSYWVPRHSPRIFVEAVDIVSGVGYRRAADAGPEASRFHEIRVVLSDLAVLDFATPDHAMRLRSVHPGVEVDDVVAATGFELAMPDAVPTTRVPTATELDWIRTRLDPDGRRDDEVSG